MADAGRNAADEGAAGGASRKSDGDRIVAAGDRGPPPRRHSTSVKTSEG
jgi:hypothetical protein